MFSIILKHIIILLNLNSQESYPMELHLVHYKLQYGNDIGSALKNAPGAKDSLAVLGIMFKLQDEDNKVLGMWHWLVFMGESAQLAPSNCFYVVTSAIMGCKSFKVGGSFWIVFLKKYRSKDLTSYLD